MDGIKGWALDDDDLRQLKLLDHIAENGQWPHPCTLPEWASQPGSTEHTAARMHARAFNAQGFLDLYDEGAMPSLMISSAGASMAQRLQTHRDDRRDRDAGCHDAILAWLDDQAVQGICVPQISGFKSSQFARWFGEPFTDEEIARATVALRDDDMIGGTGSWGGGIVRPSLKPKGQRLSRSGRSFFDADPPQSSVTNNVTQYGAHSNAQAAGHGATQSIANHVSDDHRQQALQLADTVVQAQASLSDDAAAAARAVRDAVRDGQDDPGVVRSALLNLRATLIGGSFDLVGKAILGGSAGLFAHYGINVG